MRPVTATARAEISILGPLSVSVDNHAVVVSGRRRRALIARLALDPGRPVSIGRLAEDLWEDDVEHRSIPTLRTYIAKLRQLIPDGAAILTSGPAGYALAVEPTSVDAYRFEQLVHTTDGADSDRLLAEALAMWRGNALEEFAHHDWARPLAARLDEMRLFAYGRLFDAQLASGRHAAIVDMLTALVQVHPLRELFHVQLVTALYRSGRQAEALDAQRWARALLLEELGLEPGVELASLEQRILQHDLTITAPASGVVVTSSDRSSALPLALQQRGYDPGFVGRAAHLDRIEALLVGCENAHLVAITGEAGIGKSRLAAEAAKAARSAGALILHGSCDEHLDVPYQPFVEALSDFASRAPLEELASALGRDAGAFVQLLPGFARFLPVGPEVWATSDPSAERHRLFEAVVGWIETLSDASPVVFVIDDLHWASRPSVLLVSHLVRRLRNRPVLLIATIRTDEGHADGSVLAEAIAKLQRDRAMDTINLGGFGIAEATMLVEVEGQTLVEGAIEALLIATGGNPFLLTEAVRAASDAGEVVIPESIRNVLIPRVERLQGPTRNLLAFASAVGLEFDLDTVGTACALSEDDALSALDEAIVAGFVAPVDGAAGRVAFRHGIAQQAIYEASSVARRMAVHRRIAVVMEQRADNQVTLARSAELARHWREAGPPHRATAAWWSGRAGQLALRQLAYDEAAAHFERALTLGGDDPAARLALHLDLATAHMRAGNAIRGREAVLAAIDLARALGDSTALARAALGTAAGGRGVSSWIADEVRVAALGEAYRGAIEDLALRVCVGGELALALYLPDQRSERQAIAQEALALALDDGSPAVLVAALPASRVAFWRAEHTEQRLKFARTVETIAIEAGDVWLQASVLVYIRGDCNELGDRAAFDRAGAAIDALAARTGGVVLRWRTLVAATHDALLAGAFEDAERLANQALTCWADDPAPDAVQTFGYHLGLVRIGQGRHADAIELTKTAIMMWPNALGLCAVLASQYAAVGDDERARSLLSSCIADDLARMPRDSGWLIALAFLADAAAHLRDIDAIAILTEVLTPLADRFATIASPDISLGSVASYLGAMAAARDDRRAAIDWLERACRLERGFGDHRSLDRSQRWLDEAIESGF
jgi:DNA-binding SARP family transcriptional activator/tetratricopeptide (TPR) repeat protein